MDFQDLHQHLTIYCSYLSTRLDIAPQSRVAYQTDIRQFDAWISTIPLSYSDTLSQIVNQYVYYLLYEKNLKPRSIKRKIISLKTFAKFYKQKHPELSNVLWEHPLRLPKSTILPKILNPEEAVQLLTCVQEQLQYSTPYHSIFAVRDLAILDLLLSTGIRIGELSNIKVNDLDLNTHCLRIMGKGSKERLIYISVPDVIHEINNWLLKRTLLSTESPYLFLNKYGNKLSIYAIENIFYKYRDLSHINPNATPHYLRHTFASVDTFAA